MLVEYDIGGFILTGLLFFIIISNYVNIVEIRRTLEEKYNKKGK